jgi:hypothetical protein
MAVRALLVALAAARERLVALELSLRGRPDVVQTWSMMDCRHALAGPALEWRVEAELRGGAVLTWWLEACQDDGDWVLEASVTLEGDRAARTLVQVPTRLTPATGELGPDLAAQVSALADAVPAERIADLARPPG